MAVRTVRVHVGDDLLAEVPRSPCQALVPGLDLLNLAAEGVLRFEPAQPVPYGEARWGKGVRLA